VKAVPMSEKRRQAADAEEERCQQRGTVRPQQQTQTWRVPPDRCFDTSDNQPEKWIYAKHAAV